MKTKISHLGVASLVFVSAVFVPACMRSTGWVTRVGGTIGVYSFNEGNQIPVDTSFSSGVFFRLDRTTPDLIELGYEQIKSELSDIALVRGSYQYSFFKTRRGRFRIYAIGGGGVATEQMQTGEITSAFGELGLGGYLQLRTLKLEGRITTLLFFDSDNIENALGLTAAIGF